MDINDNKRRISCPFCSEKILSNAKKCRYCGEWINKHSTKLKNKFSIKKIILGVIVLILLIFIIKDFFTPKINESNKDANNKTSQKYSCERTEPYKLEPEFERARSLRAQRKSQSGKNMDYSWYNCIKIEYKNLSDADGLFYFDKNSSTQQLTIFVSDNYRSSDDLLTSILLEHEFAHVGQFIEEINSGVKIPCIKAEALAFYNQYFYLLDLNEEEIRSIEQKLKSYNIGQYDNVKTESAMTNLKNIDEIGQTADKYCRNTTNNDSEWSKCFYVKTYDLIYNFVENNPFYQKQCANQ